MTSASHHIVGVCFRATQPLYILLILSSMLNGRFWKITNFNLSGPPEFQAFMALNASHNLSGSKKCKYRKLFENRSLLLIFSSSDREKSFDCNSEGSKSSINWCLMDWLPGKWLASTVTLHQKVIMYCQIDYYSLRVI